MPHPVRVRAPRKIGTLARESATFMATAAADDTGIYVAAASVECSHGSHWSSPFRRLGGPSSAPRCELYCRCCFFFLQIFSHYTRFPPVHPRPFPTPRQLVVHARFSTAEGFSPPPRKKGSFVCPGGRGKDGGRMGRSRARTFRAVSVVCSTRVSAVVWSRARWPVGSSQDARLDDRRNSPGENLSTPFLLTTIFFPPPREIGSGYRAVFFLFLPGHRPR